MADVFASGIGESHGHDEGIDGAMTASGYTLRSFLMDLLADNPELAATDFANAPRESRVVLCSTRTVDVAAHFMAEVQAQMAKARH